MNCAFYGFHIVLVGRGRHYMAGCWKAIMANDVVDLPEVCLSHDNRMNTVPFR